MGGTLKYTVWDFMHQHAFMSSAPGVRDGQADGHGRCAGTRRQPLAWTAQALSRVPAPGHMQT